MRRETLNRIIGHLVAIDLFIGFSAFVLKSASTRLTWVFIASLILLFWLVLARLFTLLDTLAN